MSRPALVALPLSSSQENCLTSCLRKLFCITVRKKVAAAFTISQSVADVKTELEQLNADGPVEMSFAYLAAMERSLPDASFRYAVIYRNEKPVLFVYFQVYTLTSRNFNLGKNTGFVKRIVRFFLDLKKVNVLISGNALRNETAGYCFDKHALGINEAVEIIAAAGEQIATDEKAAAVVIKDVPESLHIANWFAAAGFQAPWEDNVMVMDLPATWLSFNEYLTSLSRKYKTRARKILASGDTLHSRQLTCADVGHYSARIAQLFKQVAHNQSFVLTHPGQGHFASLKEIYGDQFEIVGFFDGNDLVAFHTAFVTDEAYELYYVGFHYEHNNQYQLYFNLLFSGLERAIALRKPRLKLGRTSFDAKASLGAKAISLQYHFKPVNIPQVVSNWFTRYFSSMEDAKWKLRHPLKQDAVV